MKIKEAPRKSFFAKLKLTPKKIFKYLSILFVIGVLQLCFFVLIVVSTQSELALASIKNILSNKANFIYSTAKYHVKSLFSEEESININIKHLNFQRLSYERQMALDGNIKKASRDKGMSNFTYVPAKIDYKGKSYNVKLRLKGDRKDHYDDESKWSFRVRLKGDKTLFGMKIFSLHKPAMKNYIHEWIYHKALEREDVLSLRYKFVNVMVNGKNLGTYALEEHFDKLLLEHRKRKDGPILRFNEDFGHAYKLSVSPIDPYTKGKWTATPDMLKQLEHAVSLLESFRQGKQKVSDVFDVKKLATYFAVTDMMASHHGAAWKSMRFYYNPITSRLEPIGFDGHYGATMPASHISSEIGINPESTWVYSLYGEWFRMFFNDMKTIDQEFIYEYVSALKRISEKSYLDELFVDLDKELEKNLTTIHNDFPLFSDHLHVIGPDPFYFNKEVYYNIQKVNDNLFKNHNQLLRAYFGGVNKGKLTLEIGNLQSLPLEVRFIQLGDTRLYPKVTTFLSSGKTIKTDKSVPTYLKIKALITGGRVTKAVAHVPKYLNFSFDLPSDFKWLDQNVKDMVVTYSIFGQEEFRTVQVYPWSFLKQGFEKDDLMRKKANIEEFEFLDINKADKTISVKQGNWVVDKNMIIPSGHKVIARSGTSLNLKNKSSIVSYSPIEFIGTKENPVKVFSDGTGGGILVLNTSETSTIKNTIFENLSNPAWGSWSVTGAVTFYKTDVNIESSEFNSNRSEDGLNIVRSSFTINTTIFNNAQSDALDVDFSSGKITKTNFKNIGNDAIDLSGGSVVMKNIIIDGAGDKGVSVGEGNDSGGEYLSIKNTAIAVASKDNSILKLNYVDISNSEIGLTVFQKKSEFGAGTIIANKVSIIDTEIPYLVEKNSTLIKDNDKVVHSKKNVSELLYGAVYGKSSK